MKTVVLTPNSSVKSSTTMESSVSDTRDSYYFPGCRKDANCNCEICLASINATLDLMPQSHHRSTLTKLSASKPVIPRSPISFHPSLDDVSTPKSSVPARRVLASPPLNWTAGVSYSERMDKKKRKLGYGIFVCRLLLVLGLGFVAEYGFSLMVSGVVKPQFSPEFVRILGEKSRVLKDLNGRLLFLKNELQDLVDRKVSSCSNDRSLWKINQGGLLLNSQCILYKSMSEEVSIWGWPLQTSGLLTAEYCSQSFTIISGRVIEWNNGKVSYVIRDANSSWEQGKWSASPVQLDANTWILEYKQSFLVENGRLISAVMEFLKFRLTRELQKMKQEFWLLFAFSSQYADDYTGRSNTIPT